MANYMIMYEDKAWVDAKLEEIDRKLMEIESYDVDEEQQYKIFKLAFDELLERLPVWRPLLSQIMVQYESVINSIIEKKRNATRFEQNQLTRSTEDSTIRNYQQYANEIELKLAEAHGECLRIQNELEAMSNEIMMVKQKQEEMMRQQRLSRPRMTSTKRRLLRLQGAEATDIACLERELQRIKQELEEVRVTSDRRYVAVQRKHSLQKQLAEKEEVRAEFAERARYLRSVLKKLNVAHDAVLEYTDCDEEDQAHTDLVGFVMKALATLKGVEDDVEVKDDPEKEREAEVILDCFESFNDLFQDGLFEQAAVMAANSPKGVLRSYSIMEKFKASAKPQNGGKPPLLIYCEALLESAAVYKPLSLEESLVCAECILQQGEGAPGLAHWIEQRFLPMSTHLGKLIYSQCKCSKSCTCGCKGLAFSVFDICNSFQLAAQCLVEQSKYASFLALGQRAEFSKEDYASILYSAPTVEFAAFLTLHPSISASVLTLFEAMHLLTTSLTATEGIKLLEKYSKQVRQSITETILQDDRTSWDTWQSLIHHLQTEGFDDWAVDFYAALVVKMTLAQVLEGIKQEQDVVDARQQEIPSSHTELEPRSTAPSGYSSSSEEVSEDDHEAADEQSSGDQNSDHQ